MTWDSRGRRTLHLTLASSRASRAQPGLPRRIAGLPSSPMPATRRWRVGARQQQGCGPAGRRMLPGPCDWCACPRPGRFSGPRRCPGSQSDGVCVGRVWRGSRRGVSAGAGPPGFSKMHRVWGRCTRDASREECDAIGCVYVYCTGRWPGRVAGGDSGRGQGMHPHPLQPAMQRRVAREGPEGRRAAWCTCPADL